MLEAKRRTHRTIQQGIHVDIVQPAKDRLLAYTEDTRDHPPEDRRIVLEDHRHEVAHEDDHTIIKALVESHMDRSIILIEQYQRGHAPMERQQFG